MEEYMRRRGGSRRVNYESASKPQANMGEPRPAAQGPKPPRYKAPSSSQRASRPGQSNGPTGSQQKWEFKASTRPVDDIDQAYNPNPRLVVVKALSGPIDRESILDLCAYLKGKSPGAIVELRQITMSQVEIEMYTVFAAFAMKEALEVHNSKFANLKGHPVDLQVTLQAAPQPPPPRREPEPREFWDRVFTLPPAPLTSRLVHLACTAESPSSQYMNVKDLTRLLQQAKVKEHSYRFRLRPRGSQPSMIVEFWSWRNGAKQFVEFAKKELPDAECKYYLDYCDGPGRPTQIEELRELFLTSKRLRYFLAFNVILTVCLTGYAYQEYQEYKEEKLWKAAAAAVAAVAAGDDPGTAQPRISNASESAV